jgi:hypothetical protein
LRRPGGGGGWGSAVHGCVFPTPARSCAATPRRAEAG